MEKRFQVFISSTSQDLQPARKEVSEALLKSNCFPAQMELWGAVDEEQFDYIKQMIDQSDYFIVISAGMYGSIHPDTGISFTEMEFDYAQEKGIPTLRFLHADPFRTLTGAFIEQSDARRAKLLAFHEKLKTGKLCKMWHDPQELGKEVILGLNDLKNRHPAMGWVRADGRATTEAELEVAELKRIIAEQRLELEASGTGTDLDEFERIVTMFSYGFRNVFGVAEDALFEPHDLLGDVLKELSVKITPQDAIRALYDELRSTDEVFPFSAKDVTEGDTDAVLAMVEAMGLTESVRAAGKAEKIVLSPLGFRLKRYLQARRYLLAPEA